MEEKRDVKEFLVLELSNLAFPMFVASALSEIWLLLLTLSLLSLLLLLLLLLSMLAITLDTAVAETTAKVRKPVTEKTLSCFSMHVGLGVTTWEKKCWESHFHNVSHLVLVLLAFFAPKEAVERDVEEGEKNNKTSDPHVKAE